MSIVLATNGTQLYTSGLSIAGWFRAGSQEPSPYVPPGYTLAWRDEFSSYNLEDPATISVGQVKWAPYWYGWAVRAISGNSDDGFKCADYEKLNTPTGPQPYTVGQLFDNDGTFLSSKTYGRYLHDITPQDTMIMRAYSVPPDYTLANLPYDNNPFYGYPYVGSMISTENSYIQGYGYFEVRFRIMNFFPGLHFSIWLLSKSLEWPPEIDVLEVLGNDPTFWYSNVHGDPSVTEIQWQIISTYADWHTLGFERTATQLKWYLDGVLFRTHPNYLSPPSLPMFFLLTYEIAGSWEGDPSPSAPWPADFGVDYVRFYEPS